MRDVTAKPSPGNTRKHEKGTRKARETRKKKVAAVPVARDPTGRFYIAEPEVGFVKSEQASFYPVSEQERRTTIDRATRYADKNGARTVYVVA